MKTGSPAIRAITTPGFHQVMGVLAAPGLRHVATTTMRVLARTGISQLRDLGEVAAIYDSFKDPSARAAIRHVVRAVVRRRPAAAPPPTGTRSHIARLCDLVIAIAIIRDHVTATV